MELVLVRFYSYDSMSNRINIFFEVVSVVCGQIMFCWWTYLVAGHVTVQLMQGVHESGVVVCAMCWGIRAIVGQEVQLQTQRLGVSATHRSQQIKWWIVVSHFFCDIFRGLCTHHLNAPTKILRPSRRVRYKQSDRRTGRLWSGLSSHWMFAYCGYFS